MTIPDLSALLSVILGATIGLITILRRINKKQVEQALVNANVDRHEKSFQIMQLTQTEQAVRITKLEYDIKGSGDGRLSTKPGEDLKLINQ